MDNKFWDDQFNLGGNEPVSWALEGNRLMHAAKLLFDLYLNDVKSMVNGSPAHKLKNLEICKPATLLFGLAFENILKAHIINKHGSQIADGKLKNWPVNGHDLVGLAEHAGVSIDSVKQDLLSRMGAYVKWTGRYPIPIKKVDMPLKQEGVSPEWFPLPIQQHEYQSIQDFYKLLSEQIVIVKV